MLRLVPRVDAAPGLVTLVPIVAAVAALALAAIPIALAGAPVLDAYRVMFEGALGSRFALTEVIARATPLILTGLRSPSPSAPGSTTSAPRGSSTWGRSPRSSSVPEGSTARRR